MAASSAIMARDKGTLLDVQTAFLEGQTACSTCMQSRPLSSLRKHTAAALPLRRRSSIVASRLRLVASIHQSLG